MAAWRVFITSAAERAMRKLPQDVRDFVFEKSPHIVKENPFIGEQLTGPFLWLRSFHYAGYRGGFYERLRRLI